MGDAQRTHDPDRTGPAPQSQPANVEGQIVGRYLLLRSLGRGGGGEVFSAFDPVLDRKVAIKFLHGSDHAREALINEGRMLAKVVHPAVVEIYEVGFHDEQAFMAMELVDGDFESFAEERRTTGDLAALLDGLRSIAAGIIAAHEAGVIHGDIKPSNVLGAAPTQLKVSDFGIARVLANEAPDDDGAAGTPAYMAPEQLASGHTDERSDQYSYCLMAWTVLAGTHPFDRLTHASARTSDSAVTAGNMPPQLSRESAPVWPKTRGVPRHVADALQRGLASDPDQRWPSMAALLASLSPNPARRRIRNVAIAAIALTAGAGGIKAYENYTLRQRVAHCDAAGDEIDGSWNEASASNVRDALVLTGASYAETTADKVIARLDTWSADWRSHRTEVCANTLVTSQWSEATHSRAQWCLVRRKLKFDAAVAELQRSDESTLPKAIALASSLPRTHTCTDLGALMNRPRPPSGEAQERFATFLAELSRASALQRTGRYEEGLAAARKASETAAEMDDPQAIALADISEGRLLTDSGAYADAEAKLLKGYLGAASERDWVAATHSAEALILLVGLRLDRMNEGAQWAQHAEMTSRLAGDPTGLHAVSRAANLAVVKRRAGDYAESLALHQRANELATEVMGAAHPSTTIRLNNLASLHFTMGKTEEAIALFERVFELRTEWLGATHPDTISALGNVAAARSEMGHYAEARETLEHVLEMRVQVLGPSHPDTAQTLSNLGSVAKLLGDLKVGEDYLDRALAIELTHGTETHNVALTLVHLASVYSARGDQARSIATQQRALAVFKKVYGPNHKEVAGVLLNLGTDHFITEDLDAAEAAYAEALKIFEETLGPDHASVGAALNNLADVAATRGDYDKAIPLYDRAYAVWSKALGPTHQHVATVLGHLGVARIAVGQRAEGIELLQRAIKAWDAAEGVEENEALARMSLADALATDPEQHTQAVALAKRAREIVVKLGVGHTVSVAEIDTWLAEHGAG